MMLTKTQFIELVNLLCSICNSHSAKAINHYWYENEKCCCIEVKADSVDTIVDMNFELAEKITSNPHLENCDFIIRFEPYQDRPATVQAISGMTTHGSVDKIPKKGTRLLDKNEKVLNSPKNADLAQFLGIHR